MNNLIDTLNKQNRAMKYWQLIFSLSEITVKEKRSMTDSEYAELMSAAAVAQRSNKEVVEDYYKACQAVKKELNL